MYERGIVCIACCWMLLTACSPAAGCLEGESRACACTTGRTGAQVCHAGALGPCICDGDGDAGANDAATPLTGTYHHWVADTLQVPPSASAAPDYALDLDGDPIAAPDNLLGSVLGALNEQSIRTQASIDGSIAAGRLLHLFSLRSDALTDDSSVSWRVLMGASAPPGSPRFDGTGSFTVTASSPTDALLRGAIAGGQLDAGPGSIDLGLAAGPGDPIVLHLVGARVRAQVTAQGCTAGRIAGGIREDDIRTVLLPALAAAWNDTIASDPGCGMTPPMCGSDAQAVLDAFDDGVRCVGPTDCPATASTCDSGRCSCGAARCAGQLAGDMEITVEELLANTAIGVLLAPDVDLLDATGRFAPRVDGVMDSVSLGVRFTCVGATFTAPGE